MSSGMKLRFLLIVICFSFFSCGEYEVLEIRKDCQRVADSLYKEHRDSLVKHFDKICDEQKEVYYRQALDSLTRSRIDNIKNLIEK